MGQIDQPFDSSESIGSAEAVAQAAEEVAQVLIGDLTLPDGDIPLSLVLSDGLDFDVVHKPLPRAESDYLKLALFIYCEVVVTGAPAAALLMPVRGGVPGDLPTLERALSVLAIASENELLVLNARDRAGRTVERAALIERSHDAPPRYLPFIGPPAPDDPDTTERRDQHPLPGLLDLALIDAIAVAAENGPDRAFVRWLYGGGDRDGIVAAAPCPCGSGQAFSACHGDWYPLGLSPA